ncbi:MAG: hypothetical protein PHY02_03010 [Phycisphaerae bacterium]|nr:hypothetical protein [Phycisphaerae bacterium]
MREWCEKKFKSQSAKWKTIELLRRNLFFTTDYFFKLAGFGVRVDVHLIDFFATKAERREEKLTTDEHGFPRIFLATKTLRHKEV